MTNDEFIDEPATRPETPKSKSGKYRFCKECNLFIENTDKQSCKCVREDGSYSIINNDNGK